MTADREPMVIERMCRAHDDAYMKWFEDHPNSGYSKQTGPIAMLAAVRELQQVVFERGRGAKRPALEQELGELIAEHERRSEGKGK